jgi:hypothetical protein
LSAFATEEMDNKRQRRSNRISERAPPLDRHLDVCDHVAPFLDYRGLWSLSITCKAIRARVWTRRRVDALRDDAMRLANNIVSDAVATFFMEEGMIIYIGEDRTFLIVLDCNLVFGWHMRIGVKIEDDGSYCRAMYPWFTSSDAQPGRKSIDPLRRPHIVLCPRCLADTKRHADGSAWFDKPCMKCIPARPRLHKTLQLYALNDMAISHYKCEVAFSKASLIGKKIHKAMPSLLDNADGEWLISMDIIRRRLTHRRMMDIRDELTSQLRSWSRKGLQYARNSFSSELPSPL